ncbi:MAG: GNAT family N-acetyltransferase [Myxococcota bacterium]
MRIEVGEYHLSPYRPDDAGALVAALSDGLVAQTIPVIPLPYGPSEAAAYLSFRLRQQDQGFRHALAIRKPNGTLCGAIDLAPDAAAQSAELGYWLAPDLWGRGITGAAVAAFLPTAPQLGIALITARALRSNLASLKILRRNGFRLVGVQHVELRAPLGAAEAEVFEREARLAAA